MQDVATAALFPDDDREYVAVPDEPAIAGESRRDEELIPDFPLSRCLRPHNDREDRSEEELSRMAASIEAEGVQQTITAAAEEVNGEIYARVIDGWTRVIASLRAGKTTIPLRLFHRKLTDTERLVLTISGNIHRTTTSHKDLMTWLCKLKELNPGWTQADIGKAVHLSTADVSKKMRISKVIPPDLQEKIGTAPGMIAPRAAYALTHAVSEDRMRELAGQYMEGMLSVEGLEGQIERDKHRNGKKPKGKPMKITGHGWILTGSDDLEKLDTFITVLVEARKKVEKNGLPPATLPSVVTQMLKAG